MTAPFQSTCAMAEQHLTTQINGISGAGKPLVVLLKGPGKDSSMMEMILRTSGLATLRDQATLFTMSASEQETTSMPSIVKAVQKASLPAIQQSELPVVLVLNGDGKALSVTRGLVTAGELQRSLIAAVAAFQAQVQPSKPQPVDLGSDAAQSPKIASSSTGNEPESSGPPATPASADTRPAQLVQGAPHMSAASVSAAPPSSASAAALGPKAALATAQARPNTRQEAATASEQGAADPNQPVQLQIYMPDGQALRASFKGSTSLQEVCSYVNQQRPSGNSNGYRVVSLHLGKEF